MTGAGGRSDRIDLLNHVYRNLLLYIREIYGFLCVDPDERGDRSK